MTRQQQIDAALLVMLEGGDLPPDFGSFGGADAELLSVEVFFEIARRLWAREAEGRRYFALDAWGRVAWQFSHPEGLCFPSREQVQEAEAQAEAALAQYVAKWSIGWPIPAGFMECDGRRPDGSAGRHIRKARKPEEPLEVRPDRMASMRQAWVPELGPGEIYVTSAGSRLPVIAEGLIEPEHPDEPPPYPDRDYWRRRP
jgi:hypothetical protein